MDRDVLVRQLEDAFANRALLYWEIYKTFAAELGPDRAAELLGQAIERRGEAAGRTLFGGLAERTRAAACFRTRGTTRRTAASTSRCRDARCRTPGARRA